MDGFCFNVSGFDWSGSDENIFDGIFIGNGHTHDLMVILGRETGGFDVGSLGRHGCDNTVKRKGIHLLLFMIEANEKPPPVVFTQ